MIEGWSGAWKGHASCGFKHTLLPLVFVETCAVIMCCCLRGQGVELAPAVERLISGYRFELVMRTVELLLACYRLSVSIV